MEMVHGIRGFCTINTEAIMIAHLRHKYGIKRVAIVDTDVHHGDGSQDIFYHDPDTLYISFHQDGRTLYPGTGFMDEFGGPQAWGSNINIPLPPGTGDQGILKIMKELVLPILEDFGPELIINSAGQDNHFSDPLANMQVTAQGYAQIADLLHAHIAWTIAMWYNHNMTLPFIGSLKRFLPILTISSPSGRSNGLIGMMRLVAKHKGIKPFGPRVALSTMMKRV